MDNRNLNLPPEQERRMLAFRRRQVHAMSPAQRMELHSMLQQQAFAMMSSNPVALAAYVRRNHQQRRISNVRRLEATMKKG